MSEKMPTQSKEQPKSTIEQSVVKEINNISLDVKTAISAIEDNHADHAIESLHNAEVQLHNVQREIEALIRKLQEAQQDARIDHLTGLANKRAFDEAIGVAITTNRRASYNKDKSQRFHVISFDLDGFKEINDTYGHDIGDLYLKRIAEKVQHSFARGTDMLARVGGDEFSLLTYDENNIHTNTEHVHNAVLGGAQQARKELEIEKGAIPDNTGMVSASIGYTAFDPEHDTSAKDVETRADYAVYVVKASGKSGILSDIEAVKNYDVNKELYTKFLSHHQGK